MHDAQCTMHDVSCMTHDGTPIVELNQATWLGCNYKNKNTNNNNIDNISSIDNLISTKL